MFETGIWTAADVAAVLANPFYAITFDVDLCMQWGPLLLDEGTWVERNAQLIAAIGASAWLDALLRALQGNEGEPGAPRYPVEVWMQVNPATAVLIHESFAAPHVRALSEEEWIGDNVRLMTEDLGVVPYMKSLLAILRGATVMPDGTFFGFRAAGDTAH